MLKMAVVGCTGKLGRMIIKDALKSSDIEVKYAIARAGNQYVGHNMSELVGNGIDLTIINDIEEATDCDVFLDCTNAKAFMNSSLEKYGKVGKPVVIATTAFTKEDMSKIEELAQNTPVLLASNFSVALHDFIETLKFAVARISDDTDVQIIEYHHNEKKDAPSGTALTIRAALVEANERLKPEDIAICSVRAGNICGDHEVIFANCKDEIVRFKHSVSSREPFALGALDVARWLKGQPNGMYSMDDFCK